ncbi:PREDICTED: uncharacterized protein LOC106124294 isoform X1 [Papilio xuthus]|uniref:Uncharacterized protein LOC106124294 isoform X1 n=1 Tax=Papilio xuthus TaxID=66420 RepID=A0AAJ6ZNI6_PAPXU|nr:PREDICTED: uncharacterized protein LOC106124294 isoform X1 [Papilio xuthus]
MKPLLSTVVALCLILPTLAHPENIEEVKELPQSKEPVVEAEESKSQARKERCSKCSSTVGLDLKSPKDLIAALQTLPGGEVHTQQSFEGCSSSKGCAGIKVQDGKVTDKFGNLNAFGGENTFKAGSTFGSNLLNGKISGEPLWWMGANSPFKNINSASYKASSSYTSTTGGAIGAGGADLSKNIFLNPGASGFAGGQSNYDASSSSFQATKEGELDVANNPFLNGNINLAQSGLAGGKGFAAQGGSAFGAGSTTAFGSGSGYVGSSPSPFATSTGPNINLIQSAQKPSVFDIDQTQQTINDDIFAGGSNVNLQVPSGEGLQQSCLGQGYACVLRPQCSNGVTSAIPLTKKQYCDTRTEVCCRLDASLSGIPQTPLGVGFATSDTEIQGSGLLNTQSTTNQGFGVQTAFNGASSYDANQATVGNNFGSTVPVVTAIPIGSTGAFGPTNTPTGFTGSTLRPVSGQGNVLNTDTFTSQSENTNVFRPGAVGTGLKPGIPYLPPVDNTNSGTNVVSSTVFPSTPLFTTPRPVSTPRPILPRPVTTPRPYTPVRPVTTPRPVSRPTYLPPVSSTSAPGYLPPVGEQTINRETFVPSPDYNEGGIILDESRFPSTTRQPIVPVLNEIPAGCAAALKCTPIEFCTADGIISNTTIILSRDQNAYRVPLTDCKDLATGRIGKCCRDPFYTDPWPTNQLGKWVPGVFGGNDGKYVPDNRDSSSTIRNQVTGRPDVTGSTLLNIFRNPKTTPPTFGTTPGQGVQITPGYNQVPQFGQGQFTKGGVGQFGQGGIGQVTQTGIGQYGQTGIGQTGQGQIGQTGFGLIGQAGIGQTGQVGVGQNGQVGVGEYGKAGVGLVGQAGFGQRGQVGVGQVGFGQRGQVGVGQRGQGGIGQIGQVGVGQRGQVGVGQGTQVGIGQRGQVGIGQVGQTGIGQVSQTGTGLIGQAGIGQTGQVGVGQIGQGGFGQRGQVGIGQIGQGGLGQRGQVGVGQFGQGGIGQRGQVGVGQFGQGGIGQRGQVGVGQIGQRGQVGVSQIGQRGQVGVGQIGQNGIGQRGQVGGGQIGQSGIGQRGQVGIGQVGQTGIGQVGIQGIGQVGQAGIGQREQVGIGQRGQVGFGQGTQIGVGQRGQTGVGVIGQAGIGQTGQVGLGQIGQRGQGEIGQVGVGQIGIGQNGQVGIDQLGQGSVGQIGQTGIGQIGQTGVGQIGQTGVGQIGNVGVGQVGQYGVGQRGQVGIGQRGQVGIGQAGFGLAGQTGVGQTNVGQYGQAGIGQGGQGGVGQYGQAETGQYTENGIGQYTQNGVGQYTQNGLGQYTQTGVGQYSQRQIIGQGQGEIGIVGQGLGIEQGQGSIISQGKGQRNKFGLVSQGIQLETGQGQYTEQGVGKTVVQGGGVGILQGGGVGIQQGGGLITENEYGASTNRIYLQRYDGAGQCGVKHGQRPYGNHDNLEVDFAEIPWQAMVLLQSNKSLLCGGVISRPDVVLTSASCVDGLDARNVLVKGGEWKLGIDDEPLPFQIVQVKTIIFHPGYRSGSLQDDVAILYLSENLRLANNIQPICMPDSSDSINAFYNGGGQCIVTGWGKIVLQAHLEGSIMHSVNVSLIQPNECESRLQQNYPHLLDNYDRDSCACGQPTNPLNNICKVDIGSALACTTGDGYYVMQGIYSWDSGCQVGNQLAAFYKFDIEWYEWAIGLTESVRYSQYGVGTKVTQTKYTGQVTSGTKGIQYNNGFKGTITNGVKGIGQGTQIGVSQGVTGQGEIGIVGQGLGIEQGQGTIISQGKGQRNKYGLVSQGTIVENGQGQYTEQGVGKTVVQGGGVGIVQGGGVGIQQGGGVGILQGGGVGIQQGGGLIAENEYGASTNRIYLQRYDGAGQCGVKHGQRPYGNHDNLEVDFAEIPWQAMVLLQSNKSLLCGGVISRPDVVLTSASCVDGLDARNVLVKGGEWKLGIDDEPLPFQIVQVKTIIFHPGYRSGSLQDDVAILYLSENLRLANNIQPICMPDSSDSINAFYNGGGQCIVTGWGKIVLQAHLAGSIMHSVNVSLIQPDECESRLQQNYPHLLDNYDRDSCACGQPTNPLNNICKVDIGSALACTTGDGYYVMQGIYSWDSGCQVGNQLAAFYKFDIEWYEWAIGLTESVRYSQYGIGTKVTQTKYTGQVTSGTKGIQYNNGFKGTITNGVKGIGQGTQIGVSQGTGQTQFSTSQTKYGTDQTQFGIAKTQFDIGQIGVNHKEVSAEEFAKLFGQGQLTTNFSNFGKFDQGSTGFNSGGLNLGTEIKGPISNTFSATYSEKKYYQSEPKIITYTTKPEIVTYTTKPEIVTFTTKPEIFTYTTKPKIVTYTTKPKIITYTTKPKIITYTTKPKIVTYTTKPQFITYETSGSGTNPQYIAPGVTFNPSFSQVVGAQHKHNAECKCLENGKK